MKKLNFKKVFSGRNAVFSLLILAVVFLFGHLAFAVGFGAWAGNVVGGIIAVFIRAIAAILILLVGVLMNVAAYSDFINAQAISKGWVVVRDVCNMFFVVILLVIAFATILGQEEYGAKKMLPKLIMAAVLINFSKMICGLMIDAASVVMLTFVNAFSAIGAGNILDVLGITDVTQLDPKADVTFGTIVSAYIFGLLYVIIATVVVASMLGMLVMRIVMIWILVVLSPLAFFLQAVPGKGQQYASQWWTKWSSNLIVGPVIAFFLWLSFASLQATGNVGPIGGNAASDEYLNSQSNSSGAAADGGGLGTEAGTSAGMAQFVIAIGMLLGGMKIAQEVGGETGAVLGKGMAQLNKGKALAIGAVGGFAAGRAKWAGKGIGRGVRNAGLSAVGAGANVFGKRDPITGKKKGTAVGDFALQWRDDMKDSRKKVKVANREKFLKNIGVGENAAEKGKVITDNLKVQSLSKGSKNFSKGALVGASFGSFAGPIGTAVGAFIGGGAGIAKGMISKNKYKTAQKQKNLYEGSALKNADDNEINSLQTKITNNPDYKEKNWSQSEKGAVKRRRDNEKNKKIIASREAAPALEITGKAFKSMTLKQKKAEDRVGVMAKDKDYFSDLGPGAIYRNDGISDDQKRWLTLLNKGGAGTNGEAALQNLVKQLNGTAGSKQLKDPEAVELAKLIAAFKKDEKNSINPSGLGQVEALLKNRPGPADTNPDNYADKVLLNYKEFDKGKMIMNEGGGGLNIDTFASNSVKEPENRDENKDYVNASFAKINTKARAEGIDMEELKMAPNANINKEQMGRVSLVMSMLIDDEIKALQAAGAGIKDKDLKAVNDSEIGKLSAAKDRFVKNDLSKLSLNNTDVIYKGNSAHDLDGEIEKANNDSYKRRNRYNGIQHEAIHKSGAKDEDVTHYSADALQDAQLIGRIPGQKDKRYDTEIGGIIAGLENLKIEKDTIKKIVAEQIGKWKVPNVQRVIETENGERDSVTEITTTEDNTKKVAVPGSTVNTENFDKAIENFDKAIEKLTGSLNKPLGSSGKETASQSMSNSDKQFFRSMFTSLKKTISKDDKLIGEKLSPLGAMASKEEKSENV